MPGRPIFIRIDMAVLLVIHLLIAIALVISVLLQRSEGGALGVGGGTMGGLMTTRGSASFMTRLTAILAACFMGTSITLAILAGGGQKARSIMEQAPASQQQPAPPSQPAVPLVK